MEGSAVVGGLAKSFVVYLHTCVKRPEAIKLKKVEWTIFMSQKPFVVGNILCMQPTAFLDAILASLTSVLAKPLALSSFQYGFIKLFCHSVNEFWLGLQKDNMQHMTRP